MSVFAEYANYYTLLYQDKDYGAEADYIDSLMKRYGKGQIKSILDIGCGTGAHGFLFAQRGYRVCGIDRSDDMVSLAQRRAAGRPDIRFLVGDATTFHLERTFDAIVSLFHVIDYQVSDEAVRALFANAAQHLAGGGLFVFDFWYGPAVLACRPEVRIKRVENAEVRLTRIAEPVMHEKEHVVDVNYEMFIEHRDTGAIAKVQETHRMRYFFLPELASLLEQAGLQLVKSLAWMTDAQDLNAGSWSGVILARKAPE